MPGNPRAAKKRTSEQSFFVHPKVASMYQLASDRQADTLLRIPALQWRGLLSRITPEVAAHLLATGSNLLVLRQP